MDKVYDHRKYEKDIYLKWESAGVFKPAGGGGKKTFTIIMPPPNASDPLHIGHARFVAIQDILVRYHRMKGDSTLWLPGADHAGIETQFVFEKKLAKIGKSRFDFDNKTLYKMIWKDVQKNRSTMENQLRALGASCDWSRNKFTLDEDVVEIVLKTFKRMYDEGLVYRGERIVNYCPKCGTFYSELEVDHVEREGMMYYIDYGPLTIATTRPETIFADSAVAVNPKDRRFKKLIGKTAMIPIVKREIPIIADSAVEMDQGTGALKVTPAHDALDFEIGERHKLQHTSVIDDMGRMINTPQQYVGKKVFTVRELVVKDLTESGYLKKQKKINHLVSVCYRDKSQIEPMIAKQWFLKVKPLTTPAIKAIKEKRVKFAAKRYEKMAMHWLQNLRDWNISRQIVWGIQIPAFRCQKCLEWTITDGRVPEKCSTCKHDKLVQDSDTFDTWFSSGQWPYATLQTTGDNDFKKFYPTSVMSTAYDIIPFWVIRMIMLGLYSTDKVPFNDVLVNGLVRDKNGIKISKSKGNVIDPMVMVEKYGSDALRSALVWGALVENDMALSEDNVRGMRNFGNKVWNIARFITSHDLYKNGVKVKPKSQNSSDKKILKNLNDLQKNVTTDLEKYRLNDAIERIYDFAWNKLASSYLEKTKKRREDAQPVLEYVLQQTLILLHPFMPFLTEQIWSQNFANNKKDLLIGRDW